MWRRRAFLSLFALSAFVTVSAQGDDSVSITSSTSTIDTFADFTYEFKNEAGHVLNNITLALVEGSAEDNGNSVIDIMVANLSSASTTSFTYTLFPGIPSGTYHARLTGTIYNGDSVLSGNSSASALSNTFSIPDSGVPCSAGTFTPVTSVTDSAYSPVRITAPVGGGVLVQSSLTGPAGSFVIHVDAVDALFVANLEPTTIEVINTQTGFNAGVQHTQLALDATILYMTNNVTLDPGSWKVRMNFTVLAPSNYPGVFSLQSEEFFVVAASGDSPNCTSSSSTASASSASTSGGNPTSTSGASAPSGTTPTQSHQTSASATSGGTNPAQSSPAPSSNMASMPLNPLQNFWLCVFISICVLFTVGEL
ncbi:BTB domain-containing protein [Mycena sanguinolenta]|uniref:BTB domain-containing protein n=1 Tax=Mycena sanguinolenta TaxID=230812 RepID=A0A8H6ZG84_9AGAR|nr:BTB domain-containing protein [Mycena sanguinolenta]